MIKGEAEIDLIKDLIADVREGLSAGDVSQYELVQLYDVFMRLMDETFRAKDTGMKTALASLEYAARRQKKRLEERLALTN